MAVQERKRLVPPGASGGPPKIEYENEVAPKAEKPKTVSGFAENVLEDAFEILEGLYQMIPTTAKAAGDIWKDRAWLSKILENPELLGNELANTAGAVKDAVIEPYRKHGFGVVYHRPVTAASDLIAVITLGGGSMSRAGKLAKAAGLPNADKLIRAGQFLERLPGRVARGGIDNVMRGVTGGKVDLAKRREFLTLKREELSVGDVKFNADLKTIGKKVLDLSDDEAAMFHKWRTVGGSADEWAANPKVADAYSAYRELVEKTWQPELRARNVLSEAKERHALIKKYRAEMDETYGRKVSNAEAAKAIDDAHVKPVYGPAKFEGGKFAATADDFLTGPSTRAAGKVGFLEEFKGAKGSIKDPRRYIPLAMKAFRDVEARFRMSERLLQSPKLIAAQGKAARGAEGLKTEHVPEGVYRKYYDDRVRAEALSKITDPTIKRLMRLEWARPTGSLRGVVRVYDRILSLFRRSATILNPRWYVGNAVGDAVLGTLAGSDWMKAKRMLDKMAMPPEVKARFGMAMEPGLSAKWLEKASDIGNAADQATRAGIITREVARQLKAAGSSFEASSEVMEAVLRSTEGFSEVQVRLQLLKEGIERRNIDVARLDRQIQTLRKMEAGRLEKLDQLTAPMDLARQRRRVADLTDRIAKRELSGSLKDLDRLTEEALGKIPGLNDLRDPRQIGAVRAQVRRDLTNRMYKDAVARAHEIAVERVGREAKRAQLRPAKGAERLMAEADEIQRKISTLDSKREAIARDVMDDMVKSGALEAQIPGLSEQVRIARMGVERANAFIGDYLGLDGFEQGVMRRLVPFYPWAKAMTMLAFRLPFLAPVKGFLWHRYSAAMWTMVGDQELPEWMKGYVPVMSREDGSQIWASLASYSPFGGLRVSRFGDFPIPSVVAFHEQNPFISLSYQLAGGRTIFQRTQIPYGGAEQVVSNGDGTVVRFTDDGYLKREIPQTPLISGLAHFFPITQYIESVLTPYYVNKYDAIGLPVPAYNQDGSIRYPREGYEQIAALLGLRLKTRKREDFIRSERFKVVRAVRELETAYRRADPEERETIKQTMRDYVDGQYRKFKYR